VRNAEELRQLGADLRGVAVGGLFAADDQIDVARDAHALRKRVRSRQHVGPAEAAVREHDAAVGAHHERLADHRLRLRRPHGERGHRRAVLLLEPQRGFERVEVEGVHLRLHAVPFEHAGLLVDFDLRRAGHLLDADQNIHNNPLG